jgi:hypothetical protein
MADETGFVHAFYLFDVAQEINLRAVGQQLGGEARHARLDDKAAGPPPVRYLTPPVLCGGDVLGVAEVDGFRLRVKFYDYGVISLQLSQPFSGSWPTLVALGQALVESEPLEQHAAEVCARIVDRFRSTLTGVRKSFLSEDYLVFALMRGESSQTADDIIAVHGSDIAQLVRGERQLLSAQERDEVLSHRMSYLADDLLVPAWNAAFVYDTETGLQATMEILEFANSQLLEFRYYDELLDSELARLYTELQRPHWFDRLLGRGPARAARNVQSLLIDVNDLTDRLQNAVKFFGDVFSARMFSNVAARLGLDRWTRNVDEKLKTLDDIRRFAVEQAGIGQANTLELAIALICAIELWLLVLGLAK